MFLRFLAEETPVDPIPEATPAVEPITWQDILNKIIDWATTTGIKLIIALIVMIISFKIVNLISKRIYKRLTKKNADATLSRVLFSTIRISLKVLILICLVGYVGIETASLSAVVASIGVGISLAVQGTLANFAGGVIIIIMRPFKLGDYITSNGESGTVEDIKLFYTQIVTIDNKIVHIPNGNLANNVIVNFSAKENRRVDINIPVALDADTDLAKKIIVEVCNKKENIIKDPAPFAMINNYDNNVTNITVRAWTKNADYWDVYFYLQDEIRKALNENGIQIPAKKVTVDVNK